MTSCFVFILEDSFLYVGFDVDFYVLRSLMYHVRTSLACENIRFSLLFAAGEVSRGKKSEAESDRGETDVFAG